MKAAYFSKTSEIGPSSRYRIYQFLPYLRANNVCVTIRPLFGPFYFSLLTWRPTPFRLLMKIVYVIWRFARRWRDVLSVGGADLIIIEGQLFPYMGAFVEWMMTKRYQTVIELDDAIYLTYRHGKKVPALLRMSCGAIVGNRTLARYARAYTPNVYVVPTVVDTERFRPADMGPQPSKPAQDRELIIVWIGLAYNASFLDLLKPALQRLQHERRIVLRVVSSSPYRVAGINTEFRAWGFDSEVRNLQDSDIGVMPLPDTEWTRGKCGLKLLQYMAVGIPCVASPVGVNRDIIRDGDNGYLAGTDEEWYAKLLSLCQDAGLRSKMGEKGRKTVEMEYSLKLWGPRLARYYHALAHMPG